MKQKNKKIIYINILLFAIIIAAIIILGLKYYNNKKLERIAENSIGVVQKQDINIAIRTEKANVTSRSEEIKRSSNNEENTTEKDIDENNENVTDKVEESEKSEENDQSEEKNDADSAEHSSKEEETKDEEENKYISIKEVTISQNMDLTVRTGLSREDFITLMSGVKQDTSGFFETNSGKIYDLCEQYSLNEIFFCGLISAESGWNIAQNHRNTHNYISLMSNGKLIKYSSVAEGLTEAAKKLHNNYLTPGGKFYYGKTLSAVKTKFCPSSSTWVSLVYGRMSQIVN